VGRGALSLFYFIAYSTYLHINVRSRLTFLTRIAKAARLDLTTFCGLLVRNKGGFLLGLARHKPFSSSLAGSIFSMLGRYGSGVPYSEMMQRCGIVVPFIPYRN
jgi:hypothetical protein